MLNHCSFFLSFTHPICTILFYQIPNDRHYGCVFILLLQLKGFFFQEKILVLRNFDGRFLYAFIGRHVSLLDCCLSIIPVYPYLWIIAQCNAFGNKKPPLAIIQPIRFYFLNVLYLIQTDFAKPEGCV